MEWDLVEIDPNYSFVFHLVFIVQLAFLAFFFFNFLIILADTLWTSKKLDDLSKEFKKLKNKEEFKTTLLSQKVKYGMNAWLPPILDHLVYCGETDNSNSRRIQQEKLLSEFSEKIFKNNFKLKFIMLFSLASVFFAVYESRSLFSDVSTDTMWQLIIISSITIMIIVALLILKRRFYSKIKASLVDLQLQQSGNTI